MAPAAGSTLPPASRRVEALRHTAITPISHPCRSRFFFFFFFFGFFYIMSFLCRGFVSFFLSAGVPHVFCAPTSRMQRFTLLVTCVYGQSPLSSQLGLDVRHETAQVSAVRWSFPPPPVLRELTLPSRMLFFFRRVPHSFSFVRESRSVFSVSEEGLKLPVCVRDRHAFH